MKKNFSLVGAFLFRNRGILGVPVFIVAVFLGKPSWVNFAIGLLLLMIGESIRVISVAYAGSTTRSKELKAKSLVTSGPYAYVRNPIYIGNFLIGLGGIVILCGWVWWFLWIFILLFWTYYGMIVIAEENFLRREFGNIYMEYTRGVRRFIPRMSAYPGGTQTRPDYGVAIRSEISTFWVLVVIIIVGVIKVTVK